MTSANTRLTKNMKYSFWRLETSYYRSWKLFSNSHCVNDA